MKHQLQCKWIFYNLHSAAGRTTSACAVGILAIMQGRDLSCKDPVGSCPFLLLASHLWLSDQHILLFPSLCSFIQVSTTDSGACSCFIDLIFVLQQRIHQPKLQGFSVNSVVGSHINSGSVTQETVPLPSVISPNYKECCVLVVIALLSFLIILAMLWLQAYNLCIDWNSALPSRFACFILTFSLHGSWHLITKFHSRGLSWFSRCIR